MQSVYSVQILNIACLFTSSTCVTGNKYICKSLIRKNICVCLFSVHNKICLSLQEQHV